MSERDDEMNGAIEIARFHVRHPQHRTVDAAFEQVLRELYTVSRALLRLAVSVDGPEGDKE